MAGFFSKAKDEYVEDGAEDYLSITDDKVYKDASSHALEVRVFVLDDYDNIRDILDVIRGGKTMCLIDIHLLRNKDPDELRRAVDKVKKTVEASGGEVVGFHENWILSAPHNVHIHKGKK